MEVMFVFRQCSTISIAVYNCFNPTLALQVGFNQYVNGQLVILSMKDPRPPIIRSPWLISWQQGFEALAPNLKKYKSLSDNHQIIGLVKWNFYMPHHRIFCLRQVDKIYCSINVFPCYTCYMRNCSNLDTSALPVLRIFLSDVEIHGRWSLMFDCLGNISITWTWFICPI